MNENMPSGVILMRNLDSLLTAEQSNIIRRERANTHHIHLYNVGQYWVTFDKSAYQVEHMTNLKEVPDVVKLKNNPFPIVMHIIDKNLFHSLCKSKSPVVQNKKYFQIDGIFFDSMEYNTWYLKMSDAHIQKSKQCHHVDNTNSTRTQTRPKAETVY